MKLEDFTYTFLKTLNVNIRLSKYHLEQDVETQQITQKFEYQYKQAILDKSDFEDLLENINAVANEVTMFDNPDNVNDYVDKTQINEARSAIEHAFNALIRGFNHDEFKQKFIQKLTPIDDEIQYSRFFFKDEPTENGDIIEVAITFDEDLFATEPFYPKIPGAVVNHFMTLNY